MTTLGAFYPDGQQAKRGDVLVPTTRAVPREIAGDATVDFVAVRQDGLVVVRGAESVVIKASRVGLEVRPA